MASGIDQFALFFMVDGAVAIPDGRQWLELVGLINSLDDRGYDVRRILSIAAVCAAVAGANLAQQPVAHASSHPKRVDAYDWAKTQDGCAYSDGGSGPCSQGYDCSGLVMKAYQQVGIRLPHNTQAMINSGKLTRESSPHQGDLVFYDGNNHVEIYDQHGWTFGATTSGQNAGWHDYGSSYPPDAYYRVNGAG